MKYARWNMVVYLPAYFMIKCLIDLQNDKYGKEWLINVVVIGWFAFAESKIFFLN
jgi:hypothetical protein